MTSVITLSNKNGVAFAADSASTWKGESTTTRSATQKLFALPGRQPIAFMVMGSAIFAPTGLTWDRIFYKYNKHFTKMNGKDGELGTVKDYESDFISFLNSQVDTVRNDEAIESDIYNFFMSGSSGVQSPLGWSLKLQSSQGDEDEEEDLGKFHQDPIQKSITDLDIAIERLLEGKGRWLGTSKFDEVEFKFRMKRLEKNHDPIIQFACENIIRSRLNLRSGKDTWEEDVGKGAHECMEKLTHVVYEFLAENGNRSWWKHSAAQITFGGFGSEDDYPTTVRLKTGSRLSLSEDRKTHVRVWDRNIIDPSHYSELPKLSEKDWRGSVFIEADAQSELISRVTNGMDPEISKSWGPLSFSEKTSRLFERWLTEEASKAISQVEGIGKKKTEDIIAHLRKSGYGPGYFQEKVRREIQYTGNALKREFRMGVLRLSPVELADLSLTLVELQAKVYKVVKPHATVDLPVDVCYLSKEHGFVWYRRKSLPDEKINPRVFSTHRDGSQLN